jgi:hypothetical protein
MARSRHAPIAATHPCGSLHRTDAGVILNPGPGDTTASPTAVGEIALICR